MWNLINKQVSRSIDSPPLSNEKISPLPNKKISFIASLWSLVTGYSELMAKRLEHSSCVPLRHFACIIHDGVVSFCVEIALPRRSWIGSHSVAPISRKAKRSKASTHRVRYTTAVAVYLINASARFEIFIYSATKRKIRSVWEH